MESYRTVENIEVYKGKIIDVVNDEITLPNGKTALREVVIHNGAAAIVPIDAAGNILFVRQYRHPAKAMVLEIPAGTLEKGEDPAHCALRELEEETGFIAGKMRKINQMYSAIGFCTEVLHIYLAEDLRPGKQALDEDEFVTIENYSLEDAIRMVFNGEIIDSKTMVGVLAYKEILSGR